MDIIKWGYCRLDGYWYTWKFIGSIYVEKFALLSDVDLKYSPPDLHKPYIISKQTHTSWCIILFLYNSLDEGLVQLFCTSQVIFWSEKV